MSFSTTTCLLATVFLVFLCAVEGQNYVQCYKVKVETFHRFAADFKRVLTTVTKRGDRLTDPIPLSNAYQRISSEKLFGRSGYPPNTVCEYHFVIGKINRVHFSKVHLDVGPNDPSTGVGSFRDCKRASEAMFKHRDYISLNTVHQSSVFCGRPDRVINRKIRRNKLKDNTNELIITFWSDASYSGDGFEGYFVDLRQRPPPGWRSANCRGTACERHIDGIHKINWRTLQEALDNETESLTYLTSMNLLIDWLESQSYEIDSKIHSLWDEPTTNTATSLNGTATPPSSGLSTESTPTYPSASASTQVASSSATFETTKQTHTSETGRLQSRTERPSSSHVVVTSKSNVQLERPRLGDVNSNETNQ